MIQGCPRSSSHHPHGQLWLNPATRPSLQSLLSLGPPCDPSRQPLGDPQVHSRDWSSLGTQRHYLVYRDTRSPPRNDRFLVAVVDRPASPPHGGRNQRSLSLAGTSKPSCKLFSPGKGWSLFQDEASFFFFFPLKHSRIPYSLLREQ